MEHMNQNQETTFYNQRDNSVKKKTYNPAKHVLYYLHDIVYLLSVIVVVLLLCFRVVIVSGGSMMNTLLDGDMLVILGNTFYHNPERGDIIVASKDSFRDGEPIIKRVIAVEGQEVNIIFATGDVYVDGVLLDEPYICSPTTNSEGVRFPLVVEKGYVFVLGDNRIRSKDSRSLEIGLIEKREILGKAVFLLLPGTDGGNVARDFSRIGGIS